MIKKTNTQNLRIIDSQNLYRNYKYISKRIRFLIIRPENEQEKYTSIFTAAGYRKLFPKIIELEDTTPKLQYFKPQAFIKPIQNFESIEKAQTILIFLKTSKFK